MAGAAAATRGAPSLVQFVDAVLRAYGQVVFCSNPLSGALILAALLSDGNVLVAGTGLACVCAATLMAFVVLRRDDVLRAGLLGYDAVLLGNGLALFITSARGDELSSVVPLLLAVPAAALCVPLKLALARACGALGAASLTLAFNGTLLVFLLAVPSWQALESRRVRDNEYPFRAPLGDGSGELPLLLNGAIVGVSQIFLTRNALGGALILLGMAICSRLLAFTCLVGALAGACLSRYVFGMQDNDFIVAGLASFNCALTLPAFFFFCKKKKKLKKIQKIIILFLLVSPNLRVLLMSLFALFVTSLFERALSLYLGAFGLPFLTLPFCLATLPFVVAAAPENCAAMELEEEEVEAREAKEEKEESGRRRRQRQSACGVFWCGRVRRVPLAELSTPGAHWRAQRASS